MYYRIDEEYEEATRCFKEGDEKLEEAFQELENIFKGLQSADCPWSGENKNVLENLIALCVMYHGKLVPAAQAINPLLIELRMEAFTYMATDHCIQELMGGS